MKVTPLDLRQQRFKSVMRGFDKEEVTTFLAEVADDYEQALRDADKVREEFGRTQAQLDELREHERNLRNTLLTAQKLSDEIRNNAEQEATRVVRDAESRADLVLQKAQARLEDVQREVDNIRLKRRDAESSLESTISTLRNSLEFIRSQDARDRDEKLALHRPRPVEAPAPVAVLRPVEDVGLAQAR